MDIRQWLQNTADREPPDEQDHQGFPEFIRPQPSAAPVCTTHWHRGHRASSDPSDTARQRTRHRHRQTAAHSSSSDPFRPADVAAARSRSTTTSESSVSGRERVPIKSFERRARHKTRPDRYGPTAKKQREQGNSQPEKKSKSKRRKSHRSGDGARTTGLVQAFQLNSGPKNKRLTLRPDVSAGIFRHGRASAPMAPSGPGLPDLVFNEMKFLKRPREHQDELPIDESVKAKTKKSRKELREEEISAYFQRPEGPPPPENPLLPKQTDVQPTIERAQLTNHSPRSRGVKGSRAQQVNLPEKAFLGFGSRGPQQEESHPGSKSYYTWSESLPHRSSAVIQPVERPRPAADPKPKEKSSLPKAMTGRVVNAKPSPKDSPDQPQHGTIREDGLNSSVSGRWRQTRRARGPALVEIFEPSARANISPNRQPRYLESPLGSSHSIRINRLVSNRPQRTEQDSRKTSERYHTSDILKLQEIDANSKRSPSLPEDHGTFDSMSAKENQAPVPTTPTSNILRQAFNAVAKSDDDHASTRQDVHSPISHQREAPRPPQHPAPTHQMYTDFDPADYVDEHGKPHSNTESQDIPQRYFSRTGESTYSQRKPPSRLELVRPAGNRQGLGLPPFHGTALHEKFDAVQDQEILDVLPATYVPPWKGTLAYADNRQAEDLLRRLASDHAPDSYHQAPTHLEPQPDSRDFEEAFGKDFEEDGTGADTLDEDPLELAEGHLDDGLYDGYENETTMDEFAGFWKPNKLY